jgi:hypothetical protein
MNMHRFKTVLMMFILFVVLQEVVGQKCVRRGYRCRDRKPPGHDHGLCESTGSSYRCIRIGRYCRCQATEVLNDPAPIPTESTDDFVIDTDINK